MSQNLINMVLGGAAIGLPIIICVAKLANFKNRNGMLWVSLSVLLPSLLVFLVLALLPQVRSDYDKKDCSDNFTKKYNKLGYTLLLVMSVILTGYSYYNIYSHELPPALQLNWLHMHIPFAYVAYSAVFSIFILSIIRLIKNEQFHSVSIALQLFALIMFSISFASGAIWANISWGNYWMWDPKQTWSLILLYVMVCTYTYSVKSTPNKVKYFVASSFQAAVVLMLFIGVCSFLSGLHCYG